MPTLKPAKPLRRPGFARQLATLWLWAVMVVSGSAVPAGLILTGITVASAAAWARPQVVDVELLRGGDSGQVRFVLDAPVDYRLFTLADPLRLVLDLAEVEWRAPAAQLERVAQRSGAVRAVRRGNFSSGTLRIVFDLDRPVRVTDARLLPHGSQSALLLTWEVAGQYQAQRLGDIREVPVPPPRPLRREARPPPVIVLDPGHGGIDPGAIGRRGTLEKDVTLAVSRELQKALRTTGRYEVVLTRNDDRFLALRERTQIARRHRASLFLSLHADSAPGAAARGLSVYTLSDRASDKEAAMLAVSENKADVIGGLDLSGEQPDVVSILIDLAQRETRNQSVRLANQLVQSMVLRVPVLERPHRQAGFAVLKSPDVPAVLVELGFLSHPEEERLLLSAAHREAIIEGIVAAVDNFFGVRQAANVGVGG